MLSFLLLNAPTQTLRTASFQNASRVTDDVAQVEAEAITKDQKPNTNGFLSRVTNWTATAWAATGAAEPAPPFVLWRGD